jgi:recombination protein RecT
MNETLTAKPLAQVKQKLPIRDWLQSTEFQQQVAKALPRSLSAPRFTRMALTATFINPKLIHCTQLSLFNCLMRLCELGLEPDGRRAHLIPYGDTCTLLIDYKGIAELIRRNGEVAHIHCDVVGVNDHFEYRFGTGGKLEHVPFLGDRGRIKCAYSYIRLKDGTEEYDVMSYEDIERVRKDHSRAGDKSPWVTDWNEMAKKTVFRRHAKLLPLSPELREMIESDDEPLTETERFNAAKPVAASVAEAPTAPKRGRPAKEPETPRVAIEQSSESLFGEQQMPPESVSVPEEPVDAAKEQNAPESLLVRVRELLIGDGFLDAHLLELLRRVKLIKDQKTLQEVDDEALRLVLEDWENCQKRLEQIKAGK